MEELEELKYLPFSKPTEGVAGKTGSWRVFRPEIDKSKCIKCLICYMVCPEVSIYVKDGAPEINYDYCKGCGICARECPVKAIQMRRER